MTAPFDRSYIQPELARLLDAPTKTEARRLAHSFVLRHSSLASLFVYAADYGLVHRAKHFDHVPDGLRLTSADHDRFFKPATEFDRQAAFRKVTEVFRQRKQVHAHLLDAPCAWHIFYFANDDVLGKHGRMGPHVHYLSHLSAPGLACGEIWQRLDERVYKMGSDFHIQYDLDA